jgi:hypothetical protein
MAEANGKHRYDTIKASLSIATQGRGSIEEVGFLPLINSCLDNY